MSTIKSHLSFVSYMFKLFFVRILSEFVAFAKEFYRVSKKLYSFADKLLLIKNQKLPIHVLKRLII